MKDEGAANRLKRIAAVWIVVLAVLYFGCRIEAALNPWLQTAEYRWWNVLTTQHFLPWLSLHRPVTFAVILIAVSVLVTIAFAWAKPTIQQSGAAFKKHAAEDINPDRVLCVSQSPEHSK